MDNNQSIILKDNETLSELFGVHDENIKLLEELFRVKLYTRGNEIVLETADEKIVNNFKSVLHQLESHIKLGQLPGPDLIRAVHRSIKDGEEEKADLLKEINILVPHAKNKIFPRSYNQARYMNAMKKREMVFCIGPAGTGKTFLAVAQALTEVLSHQKRKLIITRPVVEAGESLGYLPGDLEQKIHPYLRPIYDAIERLIPLSVIKKLEENGMIEIAPLAYMRGRTLSDCFVILDEAQNTSRKQMMMFLTRIDTGSKAVITGDITQIDLPKRQNSGLIQVMSVLKSIEEIQFILFDKEDVVRNPLVKKIVHAYESVQEDS
ncbi:MAG: PhoH family protein [Spirochaetales bacterium]|nr:PhoH family protein [Spirochaetales bacterium]